MIKDRVVIASNNSAMMNYASVMTLKTRILWRKNGVAEHLIPTHRNDSCTEFFKILKILPLSAQYSLLMFVVNNRNLFLDNVELYTIKTRNSYNLHPPLIPLKQIPKRSTLCGY